MEGIQDFRLVRIEMGGWRGDWDRGEVGYIVVLKVVAGDDEASSEEPSAGRNKRGKWLRRHKLIIYKYIES